jgi:hypothetical protein
MEIEIKNIHGETVEREVHECALEIDVAMIITQILYNPLFSVNIFTIRQFVTINFLWFDPIAVQYIY